ncbi:MAG: hypothetical protein IJW49_00960 [Clostridia bacterium]|nr:hypothetical protein [Clostridia bacterium]
MLEKLAKKRKLIAIICGVVLLALLLLEIIFGNPDDKITIIVATVIGLPFFYFGIKFGFKIVRINASPKIMRFGSWFFLIVSAIGIVASVPNYIRYFPNGFSPLVSCVMGVWLGILTDVEKHIEDK